MPGKLAAWQVAWLCAACGWSFCKMQRFPFGHVWTCSINLLASQSQRVIDILCFPASFCQWHIVFGRHGTIGATYVGHMDKLPNNDTVKMVWEVAGQLSWLHVNTYLYDTSRLVGCWLSTCHSQNDMQLWAQFSLRLHCRLARAMPRSLGSNPRCTCWRLSHCHRAHGPRFPEHGWPRKASMHQRQLPVQNRQESSKSAGSSDGKLKDCHAFEFHINFLWLQRSLAKNSVYVSEEWPAQTRTMIFSIDSIILEETSRRKLIVYACWLNLMQVFQLLIQVKS